MTATPVAAAPHAARPLARPQVARVGVVSYLNTLPLIAGLEKLANLHLHAEVPALLSGLLADGVVDLALCSAVDYQRSAVPLQLVPVGMLGCCGRTHTVRLYARVPFAQVRTLAADQESHTSRALAQVILRQRYGAAPTQVDYDRAHGPRRPDTDAMLLIGDKVVNDAPPDSEWAHQLDLGQAWFDWTGLPFVFAGWFARADLDPQQEARVRTAARVLDHQRRHNQERLGQIVAQHAAQHGWPAPLALEYLRSMLRFDFTPQAAQGLDRFFQECVNAGVCSTAHPVRTFAW